MDKEAQEFISDDAMNGLLFLTEHDRTPTWLELDRFIKALGYHKLQGEPPLLSSLELERILNTPRSLIQCEDATYIQRDRDIEWMRGNE